MAEASTNGEAGQGRKKPKERSPNFPRHDLEDAIGKARTIYQKERRNEAPRDVVLSHWGYSAKSSSGMVALGAVRAFGLLEGAGSSLKLSNLALDIITDERPDSPERDAAIKKAALLPKVHHEVWQHYGGSLPSDENLKFYLVRQKGFTDAGAKDFIAQFRATLAFAQKQAGGNLSPEDGDSGDGIHREISPGDWVQWISQGVEQFPKPRRVVEVNEDGFAFVEGSQTGFPVSDLQVAEPPKDDPRSPTATPPLPRRQPGMNQEIFALDSGTVTLQWPAKMTADEFADFEAWIDLIKRKAKRSTATDAPPDPEDPRAA